MATGYQIDGKYLEDKYSTNRSGNIFKDTKWITLCKLADYSYGSTSSPEFISNESKLFDSDMYDIDLDGVSGYSYKDKPLPLVPKGLIPYPIRPDIINIKNINHLSPCGPFKLFTSGPITALILVGPKTGYITYNSGGGLYVRASSNDEWVSVPNSSNSKIVCVDVQGGGGGGGFADTSKSWFGTKYCNAGSGGGGGAFYSCTIELFKYRYLYVTAGAAGKGIPTWDHLVDDTNHGGDSSLTIHISNSNVNKLTAPGGKCNYSKSGGLQDGGKGGTIPNYSIAAYVNFMTICDGAAGGSSGNTASINHNMAGESGGSIDKFDTYYKYDYSAKRKGGHSLTISGSNDVYCAGGGGGASFLGQGGNSIAVGSSSVTHKGFGGGGGGGGSFWQTGDDEGEGTECGGSDGSPGAVIIYFEKS